MRRQMSLPLAQMTVHMDLDSGSQRLHVLEAGHGIALPRRRTGPLVRENYFLHLVVSGQIRFNGRTISRGGGFLIAPLSPMYLENPFEEPIEHYWVQFGGEDAAALLERAGLGAETCVFELSCTQEAVALLSDAVYREEGRGSLSLGLLGTLFSLLSLYEGADGRTAPPSWDGVNRYVHAAMAFFRRNYSSEITVEDAAAFAKVSGKYLCRLFKEQAGVTPVQFLAACRYQRACELLATTSLSVGDVSRSVGFQDPLYFSQFFRRRSGTTPTAYRRQYAHP